MPRFVRKPHYGSPRHFRFGIRKGAAFEEGAHEYDISMAFPRQALQLFEPGFPDRYVITNGFNQEEPVSLLGVCDDGGEPAVLDLESGEWPWKLSAKSITQAGTLGLIENCCVAHEEGEKLFDDGCLEQIIGIVLRDGTAVEVVGVGIWIYFAHACH